MNQWKPTTGKKTEILKRSLSKWGSESDGSNSKWMIQFPCLGAQCAASKEICYE